MKPEGTYDRNYKGNEYMRIYPYIVYYDGTEKYNGGAPIAKDIMLEKLQKMEILLHH